MEKDFPEPMPEGRSMGEELKFRAVGFLGTGFLRILGATIQYESEGEEAFQDLRQEGQPVIFTLWHAHLLPLIYRHRDQGVVALVSQHRDGEYIARVMQRMGFEAARGSSTRGGTKGLRELLRWARKGRDLAVTPDGPRGPARTMKMGALTLARLTGFPLIPTVAGSDRVWRFQSWDGFMVPKPFATFRIRYGTPMQIPRSSSDAELEDYRLRLEREMNRLTDSVEGVPAPPSHRAGSS